MSTPNDHLVKRFADPQLTFRHATLVDHGGAVVAFAMDQHRRIHYAVLDLNRSDGARGPLDVEYWPDEPALVPFPTELVQTGYGAVDPTPMPRVKLGAWPPTAPGVEAEANEALQAEDLDDFLSTTARLTADAPFQVYSDGDHIFLFRQAIGGADPVSGMVFALMDGTASAMTADAKRVFARDVSGQAVPLVDNTLLVDRFLLAGGELRPTRQVRFRRSRNKDRPHSDQDTLGAVDMVGAPFFEPTQELAFVRNLTGGSFAALLLPTQVARIQRWQIFAFDAKGNEIDAYNLERAEDGLFDTRGSQLYTSPDPSFQSAVLEAGPGECPFTRRPLVPVPAKDGFAGTAVAVTGGQHLTADLTLPRSIDALTLEMWVKRTGDEPMVQLLNSVDSKGVDALTLYAPVQNTVTLTFGPKMAPVRHTQVAFRQAQFQDTWVHLAVVLEQVSSQPQILLYVDGQSHSLVTAMARHPFVLDLKTLRLGAAMDGSAGFTGLIDEVRIWSRKVDAEELVANSRVRLTGQEAGLAAYWRFDEGSGTRVRDLTAHGNDAILSAGARWVASDAPLGATTGIRHERFQIADRVPDGGLSATLYHLQEDASGPDAPDAPTKQSARVMLAMTTRDPAAAPAEPPRIAVLDLGVNREGRLAQCPSRVHLKALAAADTKALDAMVDLQRQIKALEERIATKQDRKPQQFAAAVAHQPVGASVALWNDWALVGVPDAGRVDVYRRTNGQWAVVQQLGAPGHGELGFGAHVAIWGFRAAIVSTSPQGQLQSSLHLFELVQDTWQHTYAHTGLNGQCTSMAMGNHGDSLGVLMAVAEGALLFHWKLHQNPPQVQMVGVRHDHNGYTHGVTQVTMRGSLAAVASQMHRSIRIFRWPDLLVSPHGMHGSSHGLPSHGDAPIGLHFLVNSNELIVGDTQYTDGQRRTGALIVFANGQAGWTQRHVIPGPDVDVGFGHALATSDRGADLFIVGAPAANGYAGRVYEYGAYALMRGLGEYRRHWDGSAQSALGTTVAADGTGDDVFVAGAPGHANSQVMFLGPDPTVTANLAQKRAALKAMGNPQIGAYDGIMPWVHTDTLGMTVTGALLDWARARSAPTLAPSALGQVGLYYQGADDALMGAHFHTLSARSVFALTAGGGTLYFRARAAGAHMNQATIVISNGSLAQTCTITITEPGSGLTETWRDVARSARAIAEVLNGADPLPAGVSVAFSDPLYSTRSGSVLFRVAADERASLIVNGSATRVTQGLDPRWSAEAPGRALRFDGQRTTLDLPPGDLPGLLAPEDLTFEAWVQPDATATTARLLHAHQDDARGARGYCFGLVPATPRKGVRYAQEPDAYGWIDCGDGFDFTRDFTLEAWTHGHMAITFAVPGGNPLHLEGAGTVSLGTGGADRITSSVGSADGEWRHWALVHVAATRTFSLFVDGRASQQNKVGGWPLPAGTRLFIGQGGRGVGLRGGIFEVRIWGRARTIEEIGQTRDLALSGGETDLEACYGFAPGAAFDYGPHRRHGTFVGFSYPMIPFDGPTVIKAHQLVAGIKHPHGGVKWARSAESLYCGRWSHIACGYRQSYALAFDGQGYVDLGGSGELDIAEALTLEMVVRPDVIGREQVLLTKGSPGAGDGQTVPYSLIIDREGFLIFGFESLGDDNVSHLTRVRSSTPLKPGEVAHVAVVRERGLSVEQQQRDSSYEYTDANGQRQTAKVKTVASVNPNGWHDIRFYLNGQEVGRHRYEGEAPAHHHGHLLMAARGRADGALEGAIAEVRIWSVARTPAELGRAPTLGAKGLVGWWRLDEKRGPAALNAAGGEAGRIHGARWIVNPDPRAQAFTLFINGEPVQMHTVASDPLLGANWGDHQLTVGGMLDGGRPMQVYAGVLEEVRLWQTTRTREQVLDNLFRRVDDSLGDLIAYYPFDEDSTNLRSTHARDRGHRGRHLTLNDGPRRPASVYSTVPISHDAAQVRSPLSGIQSPFRAVGQGRLAMREYGDLQQDAARTLTGVMKRAYAYTDRQGAWSLVTGFKIGDLITEWIGQVQFDPQVIGYIEGCPPVPGENLTAGQITEAAYGWKGIAGLSSVEVVESGSVSYALGSARETNVTGAFDIAAKKNFGGSKQLLITAPLGIGTATESVKAGVDLTLKLHGDGGTTWKNDSSFGTTVNRSQSLAVSLGASWEDADNPANPHLGRRLIPGNVGFAVVQSQTADLFSLRMKHTRSLVAFRMLPNPDVPQDWNLIPFPINPLYTKQGTLDGKIGMKADGSVFTDPHFPQATQPHANLSYYRPREAYALKRRIEREEQRLLSFFEHRDTRYDDIAKDLTAEGLKVLVSGAAALGTSVMTGGTSLVAGGALVGDGVNKSMTALKQLTSRTDLPRQYAKRNLVNTYVWTADGGFFAETEQTSDVRSDTISGGYSLAGSASLTFGIELTVFGAGIGLELGATMGAGFSLTRSRTKSTEKAFSLNVAIDPPGDLQKYTWDAAKNTYVGSGDSQAGRVDAYRFMTFYLDGDVANFDALFDQVIDPLWLETNAPNAIALRQARQSNVRPPCWRVFHRVTFVSRILPKGKGPTEAPDLPAKLVANNISSNWQLIKRLEPYVKRASLGVGSLHKATEDALRRELPELLPHLDEIVEYLRSYFDSVRPRVAPDPRLFVPQGLGVPLNARPLNPPGI